MSRTISPSSIPPAGNQVPMAFPPFTKPQSGSWSILVTASSNSGTQKGFIQVLQGGQVIATQKVTLTSSPTDFTVTVDESTLVNVTSGSCNMSDISIVIGVEESPCCAGIDLPDTLQVSGGGSGTLLRNGAIGGFSGVVIVACGGRVDLSINVWCEAPGGGNPTWRIQPLCEGEIANSATSAVSANCDPFELQFNDVFFNIDQCDCDHPFDNRPQINVTITE